jgi:hypothetical protein
MSDLRREADAARQALRVKEPVDVERPARRHLVPAFLAFGRVRHA